MEAWVWIALGVGAIALLGALWLLRNRQPVSGDLLTELARANKLINDHKLPAARRLLGELVKRQPGNREILRLRYQAWKYDPTSPQFHAAATALLDHPVQDAEVNERVFEDYRDYVAVTQGRPQLNEQFYLDLARRFAASGHVNEASRMVHRSLRQDKTHAGLPSALLAVGRAYLSAGDAKRGRAILENLVALYPNSPHATTAREVDPGL